ncbi:hypothetical protein FHS11_004298 [Mucilaginibacter gotjawali]|uniref:Uncharacterized protein n=1 Tax=Mucilaginibacter gotjawali TaxID=1550579 RepID=A0A839SHX6_9SPHI|nr:hypothetical protein [Mucilaginibacter gotjawali]
MHIIQNLYRQNPPLLITKGIIEQPVNTGAKLSGQDALF